MRLTQLSQWLGLVAGFGVGALACGQSPNPAASQPNTALEPQNEPIASAMAEGCVSLAALLQRDQDAVGIMVADHHGDWAHAAMLTERLQRLSEQGMRYVFVEAVLRQKQDLIDGLPQTQEALDQHIKRRWTYKYDISQPHPLTQLLVAAAKADLNSVGLDLSKEEQSSGFDYLLERTRSVNQDWARTVQRYMKRNPAPYVLFAGQLHCHGFGRSVSDGLSDLLRIDCVMWDKSDACYRMIEGP